MPKLSPSFPSLTQPLKQKVMNTAANMMARPQPPQYAFTYEQKSSRNNYASKAKGASISASILCVLVYSSIFYIFNLSPSLVFNSTTFWFFLINTLIIIISADYGFFSSSSDRVQDPYDHFVSKSDHHPSSIPHHYYHQAYYNAPEDEVVEKQMISSISTVVEPEEVVTKDVFVVADEDDDTSAVPCQDSIWESISKEADDIIQNKDAYNTGISHAADEKIMVTKFRRTVSENLGPSTHVAVDESKNVIHRWESARHEMNDEGGEPEMESEFAKMTDEELNRRVEEFIQKFNRHIRLERHINFGTQV